MANDNTAVNEVNKKTAQFHVGLFFNETIAAVWASCDALLFHSTRDSISCSELGISVLIEWLGYDFTIESLRLEDKIFKFVFGMSSLGFSERQQLLAQIQSHFAECAYCQTINRHTIEEDKLLDNDIGSVKNWFSQ